MKPTKISILGIGLVAAAVFLGHADRGMASRINKTKRNYVTDQVLVKFKATHASSSAKAQAMGRHKISEQRALRGGDLSLMRITDGKSVTDAVTALQADDSVEYAQPNYIYSITQVPNDPKFTYQWGLKNTAQTVPNPSAADDGPDSPTTSHGTPNPGTSGSDMGLEKAWDISGGQSSTPSHDCSRTVVAVVDTGVNYKHADLASNMWTGATNHGYDYADDDDNPLDLHGHGTHVASIIGAVGNNGTATAGVCWSAKIMAVRVLDAIGSGYTSDIIDGVNYAANNGAKIINMSLGGSSYDAAFESAITSHPDILFVVAAGNDGQNNDVSGNEMYPCNYKTSNLVCVAALDASFGLPWFSNYGATTVHVGAPGVNIMSAWPGRVTFDYDDTSSLWHTSDSTWGQNRVTETNKKTRYLYNPSQTPPSAQYANSSTSRVWKHYNFSGASTDLKILMTYSRYRSTASGDYLRRALNTSTSEVDPFASDLSPASNLSNDAFGNTDAATGEPWDSAYFDVSDCRGKSMCSIGFQLYSGASGTSYGVSIRDIAIQRIQNNGVTTNVISGTSMATPHVAGLAAMLFAFNPNYTLADVVNAIKLGGKNASSLTGKTTTGKAANALGSLAYINKPTNLTVSK